MKFIKRMLASVTALIMAASLVACGQSPSGEEKEPTKEPSTLSSSEENNALSGTLDIFQFKVEINDALLAATKTYMDAHPGVKINLETVGGGTDYGAALRTKMQSSAKPALFNIGGPQDVLDFSDYLEDVSDQPWVSHVVDGLLDDVTKDGGIYGCPFSIEGYGFCYNKKIFEAADIDASSLKTYKDIDEAFSKLQTMIDNGELKDEFPMLEAVISYPVKEKWVVGMHTSNVALGQEFGSCTEAYNAKTVDFTYAPQLKELIDMQIKYTAEAENPAALNAVDYSMQVGGGLAIEKVAVIQQGNWIYPDIVNIDSEVANNLGIIPMPLNGVSEGNIPVGVPMYWAVNSQVDDNAKAIAKDFLNWLYQSEEGKKIVIEEFSFIPPFTNYGDMKPADPLGAAVSEAANAGNVAPWVFNGCPQSWAENVLGAEIQAYVGGEKTWEQAIDSAKAKWEEARK